MAYLVLARKWRPLFFKDIIGQETIAKILQNAIKQKRIAHAYLFSGPRGVGKTTTARILAKALNCEKGPAPEPCGECPSCKGITAGSFMDVIEIDGASNNSVDNIRDLREKVKYAPSVAKYKIYIIDEAHMLTQSAFNALLKTLEEPPPNVVFILATTSPNKIITTVLSRCQHLPFRRVSADTIKDRLAKICTEEGFSASPEALNIIAETADGCVRDSQTLLEQIASFTTTITEEEVKALLGLSDKTHVINTAIAILKADRMPIINTINELYESGADLKLFLNDLIKAVRDALILAETDKANTDNSTIKTTQQDQLEVLASFGSATLIATLNELLKAENMIRFSSSTRIAIEMSLLKITYIGTLRPLNKLVADIEVLINSAPLQKVISVQSEPLAITTKNVQQPIEPQIIHETVLINNAICTVVQNAATTKVPQAIEKTKEMVDSSNKATITKKVISNIEQTIEAALEKISEENHILGSKLVLASHYMEDDTVHFVFEGGNAVHVQSVTEHKKYLEKVINDVTGKPYIVNIKTVKAKKKATKDMDDIIEEYEANPVVKEALDLFGGKIVEVKPVKKKKK